MSVSWMNSSNLCLTCHDGGFLAVFRFLTRDKTLEMLKEIGKKRIKKNVATQL
jgi:hypothetical protein